MLPLSANLAYGIPISSPAGRWSMSRMRLDINSSISRSVRADSAMKSRYRGVFISCQTKQTDTPSVVSQNPSEKRHSLYLGWVSTAIDGGVTAKTFLLVMYRGACSP
jgi:hypothetical protein